MRSASIACLWRDQVIQTLQRWIGSRDDAEERNEIEKVWEMVSASSLLVTKIGSWTETTSCCLFLAIEVCHGTYQSVGCVEI